jgi:hypothetical protein
MVANNTIDEGSGTGVSALFNVVDRSMFAPALRTTVKRWLIEYGAPKRLIVDDPVPRIGDGDTMVRSPVSAIKPETQKWSTCGFKSFAHVTSLMSAVPVTPLPVIEDVSVNAGGVVGVVKSCAVTKNSNVCVLTSLLMTVRLDFNAASVGSPGEFENAEIPEIATLPVLTG